MDITALGHSGFRLRGKETTVIIDPPATTLGSSLKGITADIICVTHNHSGHSNIQGIGGTPYIVSGPGEYEVGGVLITGLRTYHDDKKGEERGSNTVYIIHMDDIVFCHLGDIGHTLNASQQQEASGADVLMVPVGGHSTIGAKEAVELVGELEPSYVIPMHYRANQSNELTSRLEPVDTFLKAMGVAQIDPVTRLTVTRSTIPAEPQVIILSPKG
jgi:L-ascorbate metabolism protein UlaG (beta-lactamase superfamily)